MSFEYFFLSVLFRSITFCQGAIRERGTILLNPFNTQSVPHFYLDRKKINRFDASSSFVHFYLGAKILIEPKMRPKATLKSIESITK